jgi:WD40 repeat protein
MITQRTLFFYLSFFMSVAVYAMEQPEEKFEWSGLPHDIRCLIGEYVGDIPVPEEVALMQEFNHGDWIFSVACTPDDKIVSGGNDGKIKVWDDNTNPMQEFDHGAWVRSVACKSDGTIVSGGDDRKVKVWGVEKPMQEFDHDDWIFSVACKSDGTIVSGGDDRKVKVWGVEKPMQEFDHGDWVLSVACKSDGTIVSGGDDGKVKVWGVENPMQEFDHGDRVRSVACTPDGTIVSGGDDRKVKVWKRVLNLGFARKISQMNGSKPRIDPLELYLAMEALAKAIREKKQTIELNPGEYASYQFLDENEFKDSIGKKITVMEKRKKRKISTEIVE